MTNEYYGAPSTPNENFLAHYGVKGMKWGVRKAVESGNSRRLDRQYAKAAKKLAKLEKRAASGKKYAKRAAALGAGAALAGGVAATGTQGISTVMKGAGTGLTKASSRLIRLNSRAKTGLGKKITGHAAIAANVAGGALKTAGGTVGEWGKKTTIANNLTSGKGKHIVNKAIMGNYGKGVQKGMHKVGGISNSGYTRLAAAGLGAGLAAGAGYNAYRAATTKRAAKKAAQFRSEMNKTFAGTKYAGQTDRPSRRRRRR